MFSWAFLFSFEDLNFSNKIQKQFSSLISKRQTLGIAASIQANTSCSQLRTLHGSTASPFLALSPFQELDDYEFGTIKFVVSPERQLWRKVTVIVQGLESGRS